jgi:hypothetical protein
MKNRIKYRSVCSCKNKQGVRSIEMKNGSLVLIGVLLVFSFVFTGCPTDISTGIPMDTIPADTPPETKEEPPETKEEDKTTKFEGTWVIEAGSISATYRFTNENFVFSSNDTTETYFAEGPISGTFEFTETTITFTLSDNSKTWTIDYTLENGDLSLSNSQGDNPTKLVNGTLAKEVVVLLSQFEGTWITELMYSLGNLVRGTYKFTGNTFEFTSDDTTENAYPKGPISGTFEFTDSKITFTLSDGSKTWSVGYYNVNALYLTNTQGNNPTNLGNFPLIRQGSGGTTFEGTWKTDYLIDGYIYATYTFTGNTFEFLSNDAEETYFAKGPIPGTFEFMEKTITFTTSGGSPKTWTMDYYDGDNVLWFTIPQGDNPTRHGYGFILKQ